MGTFQLVELPPRCREMHAKSQLGYWNSRFGGGMKAAITSQKHVRTRIQVQVDDAGRRGRVDPIARHAFYGHGNQRTAGPVAGARGSSEERQDRGAARLLLALDHSG